MNNEIISDVIIEVLEEGDDDNQKWAFYENFEGLHNWTAEEATAERLRFIDKVIKRYDEEVRR